MFFYYFVKARVKVVEEIDDLKIVNKEICEHTQISKDIGHWHILYTTYLLIYYSISILYRLFHERLLMKGESEKEKYRKIWISNNGRTHLHGTTVGRDCGEAHNVRKINCGLVIIFWFHYMSSLQRFRHRPVIKSYLAFIKVNDSLHSLTEISHVWYMAGIWWMYQRVTLKHMV